MPDGANVEQCHLRRRIDKDVRITAVAAFATQTEPNTRALRARWESTTGRIPARFEFRASDGFMSKSRPVPEIGKISYHLGRKRKRPAKKLA
jgi:hypothetical protein